MSSYLNDIGTREGGLEHTVTEAVPGFSEQIWADTLFMVCIFLTKYGVYTEQQEYVDFALNQLIIHHRLLFDEKEKLHYHGWNCEAKNHMSGIYWGRANAWIIYSSMELLEIIGDFEGRAEIEEYVKKHVEGLYKVQQDNGGFNTVLNDNTSYIEMSATSGIIAGIKKAIRNNIISDKYDKMCDKGIFLLKASVKTNGEVDYVSTGTPIMPDADAYKAIPIRATMYGQGLAVIALAEML